MEKVKIEKLLGESQFKEMIVTQLLSWELVLQKKKLTEKTIERKIKNILDFMVYLNNARLGDKNKRVKASEMNTICFEFVRDGFFSEDNIENCGIQSYRENIYYNIMTGINYIYENYFKDRELIINPLSDEQREILQEVSHNKWFKIGNIKENEKENFYDSLQVKLIEQLGIKVYFDDNNKPYVLSHELGQVIDKKNDRVLKDIRTLLDKIGLVKIDESSKYVDITMVEDFYINEQNKKQPTFRLHKDLLFMYILGLTGQSIIEFKMKYIGAFNYIEQEYNRLLIENSKLKESFYNMYNEIRKRNRDLLVVEHNKKAKKKVC